MRVFKAGNDRDRGAVMVEMAIVVPIFILLVFGMLEFGLAFKNKLTMSHAANAATRRATVLGNDGRADIEILEAFEDGLVGAASVDWIVYVDIFKANDDGSKGVYDRYTVDADGVPCDWDPCPDPSIVDPVVYGSPDDYPPCARDISLDPSDGVDTIGIEVEYTHTWVTGVLGFTDQIWHETSMGRMEPDLFSNDPPSCP
jgi:hypothetical protein